MGKLFVAVPVTIAALATAVVVSPVVADEWNERQERRAEEAYRRNAAPAYDALTALRIPGLTPCAPVGDGDMPLKICLEGAATPAEVSPALLTALRAAGATDVTSECRPVRRVEYTTCEVAGRLRGMPVSGMVWARISGKKATGAEVTLFVAPPLPKTIEELEEQVGL